MKQAWRWFGPNDPVTLDHVRQAGATDVISALHHVPPDEAWTREDVETRRDLIETTAPGQAPLTWIGVESIPVSDAVKRQGAAARREIDTWVASLEAVAAAGLRIVCYNFMPVLDWTRTDLDWPLPTGATALRFDQDRFAAFDLHILKRRGAEAEYDGAARERARKAADAMSEEDADRLARTVAAGLPGATTEALDLDAFRDRLEAYRDVDADRLRANLIAFLEIVAPAAERLGVRLTLHPDDPPRPLFGLPRIASSAADYDAVFRAVPSPANGMCFCTGSLGVSPDNDLPEIARTFAERIHFAHLRATRRDGLSFHEADHFDGDVDMVAVLSVLLAEDRRRPEAERIPFRPDHGHRMLGDLEAGRPTNPGYTAAGRMKGLAELRGAIRALERAGVLTRARRLQWLPRIVRVGAARRRQQHGALDQVGMDLHGAPEDGLGGAHAAGAHEDDGLPRHGAEMLRLQRQHALDVGQGALMIVTLEAHRGALVPRLRPVRRLGDQFVEQRLGAREVVGAAALQRLVHQHGVLRPRRPQPKVPDLHLHGEAGGLAFGHRQEAEQPFALLRVRGCVARDGGLQRLGRGNARHCRQRRRHAEPNQQRQHPSPVAHPHVSPPRFSARRRPSRPTPWRRRRRRT